MNQKNAPQQPDLDSSHELPALESSAGNPAETSAGVEELRAERDVLLDRLARMQADFENTRKRSAREQQEYRDYALADTLRSLLPVLDSLDRALRAAEEDPQQLRLGFELIQKQLQDTLSKLGVSPIAAQGEAFDPHQHEAIEMVDGDDATGDRVVEELQRGYRLRDRLLRPAMVRVARGRKSA
jgi:molecular chaperone GrpE